MRKRRGTVRGTSGVGQALIGGILETIDISTAILLLTGQLSATGIFVYPNGLYVSVTGPIFNGQRLLGKNDGSQAALNSIDVVIALMLIIGQLRVYGPFPGPHILSLAITGPALGVTGVPVPHPPGKQAQEVYTGLRQELLQQFQYRESVDEA